LRRRLGEDVRFFEEGRHEEGRVLQGCRWMVDAKTK
jgi:hypothetical protein